MADYIDIIKYLDPTAKVIIRKNNYDTIEWGDTTVISKSVLDSKSSEVDTALANEQKKNSQNKVSAYKKLSLTDDEILSIDSTLKEYL
jgi:hypothetical protein|tara:strand:+ start:47 stop:310 length:264 start_codon:yes stop_codon:yes gene_type:complete